MTPEVQSCSPDHQTKIQMPPTSDAPRVLKNWSEAVLSALLVLTALTTACVKPTDTPVPRGEGVTPSISDQMTELAPTYNAFMDTLTAEADELPEPVHDVFATERAALATPQPPDLTMEALGTDLAGQMIATYDASGVVTVTLIP